MKSILWLVVGFSAAAAYILLTNRNSSRTQEPVTELAHKLQDAWADHHTVA